MSDKKRCVAILALAALAYFVSYPEDVQAIIVPIITTITPVLNLTNAVSPWFYGVVAVGIIARATVKTWGFRASQENVALNHE
jgi:Na+/H+-translocating membrane pyrophosphatase